MKLCTMCKKMVPKTEFYSYKKTTDGLYSWCKPCSRKAKTMKRRITRGGGKFDYKCKKCLHYSEDREEKCDAFVQRPDECWAFTDDPDVMEYIENSIKAYGRRKVWDKYHA